MLQPRSWPRSSLELEELAPGAGASFRIRTQAVQQRNASLHGPGAPFHGLSHKAHITFSSWPWPDSFEVGSWRGDVGALAGSDPVV